MRADVAHREGNAVGVAGQQYRFPQHLFRDHRLPLESIAAMREIPEVLEKHTVPERSAMRYPAAMARKGFVYHDDGEDTCQ